MEKQKNKNFKLSVNCKIKFRTNKADNRNKSKILHATIFNI